MPEDLIQVSTALSDVFTAHERRRIVGFRTFLTEMIAPDIAPRAAGLGYGAAEHEQAWENLDIIEGRTLSFNDALGVARRVEMAEGSGTLNEHLRYLDGEENRWFDRFRKAIIRFIGKDHLEAFQKAFWQDLQQEPLGPGVLSSMTKLCDRYEALASNQTPGARELHETLARRGFNAELIAKIRSRIESCRKALPTTAPIPNEAKLRQVAQQRREAYTWLNAFYNDWATTLRTEVTYHQAVRLGITEVRGGRKHDVEPTSPDSEDTE